MKNLIKPVDYAAQMGISRQAVYAKIKKGILNSKNIGGKIFILLDSQSVESPAQKTETISSIEQTQTKQNQANPSSTPTDDHKELLQAKDETITILKETVQDLKDTNKMIVSTMRGEVDLLKDAFGEMKTLYRLQLEHKDINDVEPESDDEVIEVSSDQIDSEQTADIARESKTETEERAKEVKERSKEWITLKNFLSTHKITKEKKRKSLEKRLKKHLNRGDSRIDRVGKEILLLADADFSDILKKI